MRAAVLVCLFALAIVASAQTPRTGPGAMPVVIELFTSEGCSSCPPADQLLAKLTREQSVPGARIIALGEHVDYWDHQGWRDPFSSRTFTARQSDYAARVFGTERIYTPQLVVDGTAELVGSDASAARRAIERAAKRPKASLELSLSNDVATVRVVGIRSLTRRGDADVVLAITEDGLRSDVKRGENSGLTLTHAAVVRWLHTAARLPRAQETFAGEFALPLDATWRRERLRVIGFLQDRDTRRILAADEVSFH